MSRKIGFWSVFALVTGSQIGTTVFMSPASLAQYGGFSLIGWGISGCGALSLCLVFAYLCSRFPQTGGPHAYIKHLFGPVSAFFTGWTYWVISWVSTTVVVVTAVGSLSPFLGDISQLGEVALQITLLLTIMLLNLKGVQAAGKMEFILVLMKFIPLMIIPATALFYFDSANLTVAPAVEALPVPSILSQVTLLTLFGFIGLECATTPAGDVHNPSKTIPRAIIIGTMSVIALYFLNSIGIMGLIPGTELATSKAPYVDAAKIIYGGNWYFLISCIASIVCIGTLNAWILASGQIVLGLAEDGLMPERFGRKNKHGAPAFSIIISCIGIIPLLCMTANDNLASQINDIIDFSVTAFLFVYLFCALAFLKLRIKERSLTFFSSLYGLSSVIFCSWVIYMTPLITLGIAFLFVLSGLPIYFLWYKKK